YVDLPMRLTVRQNLTVYAGLYGVANAEERIAFLAEDLQLTALLDRATGKLSAGQKTRVGLAKALLNAPELLLLDEPTASLDPDTADWVRQKLKEYAQTRRATILFASHNMAEVERLADRVILLDSGHILEDESPRALIKAYGRETLEEVFLDGVRGRARRDRSGGGEGGEGSWGGCMGSRVGGLGWRRRSGLALRFAASARSSAAICISCAAQASGWSSWSIGPSCRCSLGASCRNISPAPRA